MVNVSKINKVRMIKIGEWGYEVGEDISYAFYDKDGDELTEYEFGYSSNVKGIFKNIDRVESDGSLVTIVFKDDVVCEIDKKDDVISKEYEVKCGL